jgi:capsular polysaccharide export protein
LAARGVPRRLFYFNAGFLRQKRLSRMLELAGHKLCLGLPGAGDGVAVWGQSPYAHRGERLARRFDVPLVRLEDAFLRSVHPGRTGAPPLGLMVDPVGVHFDGRTTSLLETILATHNLDNSNLMARSVAGIERLKAMDLSKYNIHESTADLPEHGFILVIDQTEGDASLRCCNAGRPRFLEMLARARAENPGQRIVIKSHPETMQNLRAGHFKPDDLGPAMQFMTAAVSPWRLLERAAAVYTVSSQMGFEAILVGHRPHVFGLPFYAGWGLSIDEMPLPRRGRARTAAQLFAAAMILAPIWYDPCRDRLCQFEQVVDQLEAEVRSYREDRRGYVALGMRLWKRSRLQAVFGRQRPICFRDDPAMALAEAAARECDMLVWASKEPEELASPDVFRGVIRRVEDGFLRSRGLGAELVPPLSLVSDDLGIYYDPSRESRLERLIAQGIAPSERTRALELQKQLIAARLSKYNLGGAALPEMPKGHKILVPGQVEDDASIRLGAGTVRHNLALIKAARAANPTAFLIYKPHPDVEAGLRPGQIAPETLAGLVDHIAQTADPIALIDTVDEVWTMTSLLGFEALLRGKSVTCLGAPFYAGWGLTTDLGPIPPRRSALTPKPDLATLIHASLIAYPRYFDPVSRLPCPPEVAVERLSSGTLPPRSAVNRVLAKLQGHFAGYAALWR